MLSAKLREKAGIGGFIAAGDTFQIWNPETYEQDQQQAEEWLDALPEDFDPLSFLDSAEVPREGHGQLDLPAAPHIPY